MWQYDRPTSSAGTTSNSDAPEWRGEWVALIYWMYEWKYTEEEIHMSKFCLPVEAMELMINYGKKNLCNRGQWPPLLSDHLTKIQIGSSISQIAISETSHKQPPPVSDHLSLIKGGRLLEVPLYSIVLFFKIPTSQCKESPLGFTFQVQIIEIMSNI